MSNYGHSGPSLKAGFWAGVEVFGQSGQKSLSARIKASKLARMVSGPITIESEYQIMIDEKAKAEFKERAADWMRESNPKFFGWTLGDVSPVKGAFYNKEEQHSEALPDGLAVPILCEKCCNTLAHYAELPDAP